jgi:hypothetical protein
MMAGPHMTRAGSGYSTGPAGPVPPWCCFSARWAHINRGTAPFPAARYGGPASERFDANLHQIYTRPTPRILAGSLPLKPPIPGRDR